MYQTRIGHAHLKVRDLEQAVDFYTRVLKLKVIETVGDHYAFLTGGEMHHEIALQAIGENAAAQNVLAPGLYHIAFEVAGKAELAEAYLAVKAEKISASTVDHLISWAIYFTDPDGNGLEIYCDTRTERNISTWRGINEPLPENKLLAIINHQSVAVENG